MKPIIVRGGGDLATGIIHRLNRGGYATIILECEKPMAIRRKVSFSEAVYDGSATVEKMTCKKVSSIKEALEKVKINQPVILVDETCSFLSEYHPEILVDAIIAKRNLGTNLTMGELTIAVGPGFAAGVDVDYVIESKRGHNLGRVLENGYAEKNSGVPGIIAGYGAERVIHAPCEGIFKPACEISDIVTKDQVLGTIEKDGTIKEVTATIDGVLRGLIREGMYLKKGTKMADIDPRIEEQQNCFTISDKARCIGGSVLEVVSGFVIDRMNR